MITTTDSQLIEALRADEGCKSSPYLDSKGIQTVGVGHNLQASPLHYSYPLTSEQIDSVLAADLEFTFDSLDRELPWWKDLPEQKQRVLANMCFNLGVGKLVKFQHFLAALKAQDYTTAAAEMLDSAWSHQVGARATRLATEMKGDPES